ncbi:hypothetical protein [Methylobacterium nonmethylotrophicum]|uniref:Secreted protein n=1 Tax=Methylobacterium nonmethylotrophicum TaxID=1141884 RepID=A0A4Z0NQ00_9HYPH|nr:hypothetical protein [Methylobacterium nonmethylotrophicum]TGD98728.1 hypothetical protein EU555_15460 [Methylobacterium nonmethylotrophicum]
MAQLCLVYCFCIIFAAEPVTTSANDAQAALQGATLLNCLVLHPVRRRTADRFGTGRSRPAE